jgi:hypothetical protein
MALAKVKNCATGRSAGDSGKKGGNEDGDVNREEEKI